MKLFSLDITLGDSDGDREPDLLVEAAVFGFDLPSMKVDMKTGLRLIAEIKKFLGR